MPRFTPAILGATVSMLVLPALLALAQPPAPRPAPAAAAAPRDTTWTDALVRHGWLEAGVGWIAAPAPMRRSFEAGQGIAAGLQARPIAPLLLRVGADYQLLLANGKANYEYLPGKIFQGDSVTFDIQGRAWLLALRAEAGWRAPGGVWLFAGGGRDYFDGGFDGFVGLVDPDVQLRVPEVARDGWGWSVTLGAARSLQPLLQWPVGIDVHWRSLRRGDEDLRLWAIRIAAMRP